MTLVDTINSAIISAMKSKNESVLPGLRAIKAAFSTALTAKNAKTIEVNGVKQIDNETAIKTLTKLASQRRESIQIYESANRMELAEKEKQELAVISSYLPKMLTNEEIRSIAGGILIGITIPNENAKIGKTVGEINKKYPGQTEPSELIKIITELVKQN